MCAAVLVVGAGPVGLAMAAELTRFGVPVRLIDKAVERTDKSKALVVWSRTLELMDGMGCTPAFLFTGRKAPAANIMAGSQVLGHIGFDGVPTPHPYALMIPQSETERLLEEHLESLGGKVERDVSLSGFVAGDEGVHSTLQFGDGRVEEIETKWLIGCDGAHSLVRHQLGMGFEGSTEQNDWILADVHLTGMPRGSEINITLHADGVLAVFPISSDRFRVIADVGPAKDGPVVNPTLEEVQALLEERGPGGVVAGNPVWLAGFRINERIVKQYREGRVFLAGDAAHIHSPAGGQGMNTGIQDACNLAWKLALVSAGTCGAEPLLESYSTERSAVGSEVVRNAGMLTAFGTLKGELKQAMRNHMASLVFGFSRAREGLAESLTEVSIGYSRSPLNGGQTGYGGPKPGERAPIREGEPAAGAGSVPKFTLFADTQGSAEVVKRFGAVLEEQVRPPFATGGIWLVRPDGYVGLAAKAGAWESVETYLNRICLTASRPQ